MSKRSPGEATQPNALAAYSVILLQHGERYLLLQRAAAKRFAPGRWTGLGGRVEADEFDQLSAAALRELAEETGIQPGEVADFTLRRALVHARPGARLTVLLYFTGRLPQPVRPTCPEGTLDWVTAAQMAALDVIENTAEVLPRLIEDVARDPAGRNLVRVGAAHYHPDGTLERLVWA